MRIVIHSPLMSVAFLEHLRGRDTLPTAVRDENGFITHCAPGLSLPYRATILTVEVRIAVTVSGLSPGDVKKRAGWQGSAMSYPRVIPHSDGAGTIDAVGPGVSQDRIASTCGATAPSPTGHSAPRPAPARGAGPTPSSATTTSSATCPSDPDDPLVWCW